MHRVFNLLILVFVSVSTYAQNPFIVRPTVVDCVHLRDHPSTDGAILGCLTANTKVLVTDSVPFWRRVELEDSSSGWIAKKFIIPDEGPTSPETDLVLEVHFVDVGQGDGIWIHTPDDGIDGNGEFEGLNIVIDGGLDSSDHNNAMLHYLRDQAHHLC